MAQVYSPNAPSYYAQQLANLQQTQLANQAKRYDMNAQQQADQAAPAALAAIAALQGNVVQDQSQGGTTQPQPPMPGQQSMPNMGTQPPIQPVQSAPIGADPPPMGVPPTAQQIPQLSASALQPPSQGGMGPAIGRMDPPPPPMGQAQGQPQQNPAAALTQQYPSMGSLIGAIRQANPNLDGAALMNLIQRVQPLYQGKSGDPYKIMLEQQRLGVGAGAPDPAVVDAAAAQIQATGNYSALNRLPAPVREAVLVKLGTGFNPADAQVNLSARKTEANATARPLGQLNVSAEGFAAIMPDALAASAAVPRDSWKFANTVDNWLKEQSNDPDFATFQNFNLGLVREYARAMGGTVAAQAKAENALGTSKNEAAYDAAVKALYREIQDAQKGGKVAVRKATGKTAQDDGVPGIKVEGGPTTGKDPFKGWGNPKVQ